MQEMRQLALPNDQSSLTNQQSDMVTMMNYIKMDKGMGPLDASVMLRKGIYDKVAAKVIL